MTEMVLESWHQTALILAENSLAWIWWSDNRCDINSYFTFFLLCLYSHACSQSASLKKNPSHTGCTGWDAPLSSLWCDSLVQGSDGADWYGGYRSPRFCSLATPSDTDAQAFAHKTIEAICTNRPYHSFPLSQSQMAFAVDNFWQLRVSLAQNYLIVSFSEFQSSPQSDCETPKREAPFAVNHH